MTRLSVELRVIPPDSTYPLFITAKRYRCHQVSKNATTLSKVDYRGSELTLILLHSTSFHKETWEACLETLFSFVGTHSRRVQSLTIREAWAIECPNHGESATLNADIFQTPEFSDHFGCEGYSRAVHRFLMQGPVSFRDRANLIGIGHSLGANSILMVQTFKPSLPFKSLIIVEPLVNPAEKDALEPLRTRLIATAAKRRDIWPSREAARLSLPGQNGNGNGNGKEGRGWWDERVADAYVEFGICPLINPTDMPARTSDGREELDSDMTSFTLACTRKQEMVMYNDDKGSVAPVKVLDQMSETLPIHLILGDVKDFIPARVHDILTAPAPGRKFASVATLPDVGHLIPQERPDTLAKAIFDILSRTSCTPPRPPVLSSRTKL